MQFVYIFCSQKIRSPSRKKLRASDSFLGRTSAVSHIDRDVQLIFPFPATKNISPLFAFAATAIISGKHFTNLWA